MLGGYQLIHICMVSTKFYKSSLTNYDFGVAMGGLLLKLQNFKKVKLIFGHPVPATLAAKIQCLYCMHVVSGIEFTTELHWVPYQLLSRRIGLLVSIPNMLLTLIYKPGRLLQPLKGFFHHF